MEETFSNTLIDSKKIYIDITYNLNNDNAIFCDVIANKYLVGKMSLRFLTSMNCSKLSYLLLLEKCFKTWMSGRVFCDSRQRFKGCLVYVSTPDFAEGVE